MIRLVKKNGEYFLQERLTRVESRSPWWKFWENRYEVIHTGWRTAETVDLNEEEHE